MSFAKDFKRQPDPLDIAKKLGLMSRGSGSNLAATAGIALSTSAPPMPMSGGGDDADSAAGGQESNVESWVELAPSRASLCSSIEAVMLESASGGDASASAKDSRLSPVSLQSPHVEFETSLEQVKYRLVKDMLPLAPDGTKSTDWLWDWSSRSAGAAEGGAAQKAARHRSGGGGQHGGQQQQQIGSTLTTPPNSPEPGSSDAEFKFGSGSRSGGIVVDGKLYIGGKPSTIKGGRRLEFGLLGVVVSNLVVFIVGTALGFYICWKGKFWASSSNSDAFDFEAAAMRFSYF